MTDETQSEIYTTGNVNDLTPGQALQRLYSYTESTGPDVGSVITLLSDTPPGVRVDGLIERIQENSESFKAPRADSDKHFTDLVGDAREAADTGDPETAIQLLDETIINHLAETISVFETVEEGAAEHHAFDENVIEEIEYVRISYDHMHDLARYARDKLSTAPS